ncbi:MAG: glycosyltransferase [Janthinobacterium lividum]
MRQQLGISIAMTTYNGASYLSDQLDSLASQQHLPSELVIADDGSTDGTITLVEDFAETAPFPVRLHRNPRKLGYKANFLHVAGLCRHALISFCDQDDIWRSDNLMKVAPCFDDPDVLMVFHNAQLVEADRRPISPFYADPPAPPLSERLSLAPWEFSYGFTQTFRASLLPAASEWQAVEDHFYPGQKMGHDLFFFLVSSGLGPVRYLDEMLTDYRLHESNTIGSGKRTKPSLIERWRYRLENRSESYRYLGHVSALDAALFNRLSQLDGVSSQFRERAGTAAAAWRILPNLYTDRMMMYSGTFRTRIAAFLRLSRVGAYGETGFWTFGAKAMKKDLVLGVLLAPLVQRLGRQPFTGDDPACRRGQASRLALEHGILGLSA